MGATKLFEASIVRKYVYINPHNTYNVCGVFFLGGWVWFVFWVFFLVFLAKYCKLILFIFTTLNVQDCYKSIYYKIFSRKYLHRQYILKVKKKSSKKSLLNVRISLWKIFACLNGDVYNDIIRKKPIKSLFFKHHHRYWNSIR